MPNFFKKLTSSFKMDEDDIFNDEEEREDKEDKEELQVEEAEKTPEPEADEDDEEPAQDAPDDNDAGESEGSQEEDNDTDSQKPAGDEGDLAEEPRPYTIAQLARAQAPKKTVKAKANRAETPISIYSKGEANTGESNMPEGQLAIDVYETPGEIIIKSTIAGAKPEDLDIGVEDNTVNIRGARHNEEKIKGEDYLYQECYWGSFSRSIILPSEVDADKTQASIKDGILTIKLPKIKREREKKIKVL